MDDEQKEFRHYHGMRAPTCDVKGCKEPKALWTKTPLCVEHARKTLGTKELERRYEAEYNEPMEGGPV
jgi:hypothetical protein